MSQSLNKIMLIGNLGKDSETRFTTANTSVTTFTLATTSSYKGKDGNFIETTEWHNVVGFKLSDYIKGQLTKGAKVYVEGKQTSRSYTDKDGVKRKSYEVVVEKVIALNPKNVETNGPQGDVDANETGYPELGENEDLPF